MRLCTYRYEREVKTVLLRTLSRPSRLSAVYGCFEVLDVPAGLAWLRMYRHCNHSGNSTDHISYRQLSRSLSHDHGFVHSSALL